MPITNRDIKRASRQVFASSRAIVTPFYNRVASSQEVEQLFSNRNDLCATAVLISAPLGTGKTFFVDQVAQQIGVAAREIPLRLRELTERELDRQKGDVVFIDEGDIKTDWQSLCKGMDIIGRHLAQSERIGLVLGDLVLRHPDLLGRLPGYHFIRNFEPLDRPFLQGVIHQRLETYVHAKRGEEVIEADLYDILVPDGTAYVNSFRSTLSLLEGVVNTLPRDDGTCSISAHLARAYVKGAFDPQFWTDRQEEFLNGLLDYLAENHVGALGLEHGLSKEELFVLGHDAGYADWESFEDEIIEPFGEQRLLLSGGIPELDGAGRFRRWVEPYYPSLDLRLMT